MIKKLALSLVPMARTIRFVPTRNTNFRFALPKQTLYYSSNLAYFRLRKGNQTIHNLRHRQIRQERIKIKKSRMVKMAKTVRN